MPPFIGQGMNSGCRDAVALAFRLESILSGLANETLLDSYTTERLGHVQQVTGLAVLLGKAICVTSEEEAAILHAHIRSSPPPPSTFRLGTPGLFTESQAGSGFLGLQRKIIPANGIPTWFDQVYARGWILLSTTADPYSSLSTTTKELFEKKLGGKAVCLTKEEDFEGEYKKWFEENASAEVMLIRPDYYVSFSSTLEGLEKSLSEFLPQVVAL